MFFQLNSPSFDVVSFVIFGKQEPPPHLLGDTAVDLRRRHTLFSKGWLGCEMCGGTLSGKRTPWSQTQPSCSSGHEPSNESPHSPVKLTERSLQLVWAKDLEQGSRDAFLQGEPRLRAQSTPIAEKRISTCCVLDSVCVQTVCTHEPKDS